MSNTQCPIFEGRGERWLNLEREGEGEAVEEPPTPRRGAADARRGAATRGGGSRRDATGAGLGVLRVEGGGRPLSGLGG